MNRDSGIVVDVGTPSSEFQEWSSAQVRFHGFANLSTAIDQYVNSSEFTFSGKQWRLRMYPGGYDGAVAGTVSIFLASLNNESSVADLRFNINKSAIQVSGVECGSTASATGWLGVVSREKVMESLVGGALVIEVFMRFDSKAQPPPFIPENPSSCKVIQNMFNDQESSDVTIEVGEHAAKSNARKKAKTSPTTFYAHRAILQQCASVLYDMCGSGEEHSTTIQITDVSPEIFRHLLHYIYGGKVSDDDMKSNARDIINAADKYGVSNLKLEAEASLVNSTTITIDNMMEHLLYAEAKNCALLKETVLDFMVDNNVEVLQKVSFNNAPGSLVSDVLAAMARGTRKSGNNASNDDQLCTMRISDLRRKVHEKGLDVDGSREMLIAALEESSE